MPKVEEYNLHPWGYENGPEERTARLSTLDYLAACTYNNYTLFFKLDDGADRAKIASILKEGLERTLAQAWHLVGTIEKNEDGGHSFVNKKDSTVGFVVQYLDTPEDDYPSFSDLEKGHFTTASLGDKIQTFSWHGLTYGERPECHPNTSPFLSAFQANFIRGGLVFNMHSHHYANDAMGWSHFTHQLADNCAAIAKGTPAPAWDPEAVEHTRFIAPDVPEESKVDGPVAAERYPHPPFSSLLFHLPKSKAEELKNSAAPSDGSWISTYDAFSAFLWRHLSKHRAAYHKSDLSSSTLWGEAVNMRPRLTNPSAPTRMQRNVFFAATTATAPQKFTTSEVISEAPLTKLATYIRGLTNGVTDAVLAATLAAVAPIRDKSSLFIRVDSFPPLSVLMTDWRDAKVVEDDFGFGQPVAFRHLFAGKIDEGLVIIYPPRRTGNPDEGFEFMIPFEKEIADNLIKDPEFGEFFEFRGYETKVAA
ncbi:acyltransferase [Durotheca rogersii]|uniref:acyltransferase n=1 Tax=Durotheca rogersii TaxID=419775 RepID=UPI002220A1BE|nr:acyltransferase [Durotheca rogersii]KAI5859536.1 acyltransferase [Durotheca rogersii]